MNITIIKNFVVLLFVVASIPAYAQDVFMQNSKYVDSVTESIRHYFCKDSLRYSDSIFLRRKLKRDLKIIEFVSAFFEKELDSASVDSIAASLKFDARFHKNTNNGLITIHEVHMPANYMKVMIKFESIGGSIYRRYCEITTSSYCSCPSFAMRMFDFSLLKNYYLKEIRFPLHFKDVSFECDTLSLEKLKTISANYPYNKFNLPDNELPGWLNKIYCNQYNSDKTYLCYHVDFADPQFIQLVKREKVDAIENLLYSPNYLYAINAMESLVYLQSLNKVTLSDSIKKKMEEVRKSNYSFFSQSSDVVHFMDNYGQLHMTNEEVIYKYRKSVSQQ